MAFNWFLALFRGFVEYKNIITDFSFAVNTSVS